MSEPSPVGGRRGTLVGSAFGVWGAWVAAASRAGSGQSSTTRGVGVSSALASAGHVLSAAHKAAATRRADTTVEGNVSRHRGHTRSGSGALAVNVVRFYRFE